ncbi:MAG: hypothetical protein H0U71_08070 [Gammaproteobacteria bacterium]|nr:hypothetical protein [Gammaproteobacteria bacterium]
MIIHRLEQPLVDNFEAFNHANPPPRFLNLLLVCACICGEAESAEHFIQNNADVDFYEKDFFDGRAPRFSLSVWQS